MRELYGEVNEGVFDENAGLGSEEIGEVILAEFLRTSQDEERGVLVSGFKQLLFSNLSLFVVGGFGILNESSERHEQSFPKLF